MTLRPSPGDIANQFRILRILGLSCPEAGRFEDAIEQYEMFLDIWKNADEGLKSVEDAKARLARLKSET